jgi:hypothetical protein
MIGQYAAGRVPPQDRGRTGRRNRPIKRFLQGHGLAVTGYGNDKQSPVHNLRNGHRYRVTRYILNARKPTFAMLLRTATLVEQYSLEALFVVEHRRRIIEVAGFV